MHCNRPQEILARSLTSGGDTGRLISKKMKKNQSKKKGYGENVDVDADEYPGYARFVEEATVGYSAMQVCALFVCLALRMVHVHDQCAFAKRSSRFLSAINLA